MVTNFIHRRFDFEPAAAAIEPQRRYGQEQLPALRAAAVNRVAHRVLNQNTEPLSMISSRKIYIDQTKGG